MGNGSIFNAPSDFSVKRPGEVSVQMGDTLHPPYSCLIYQGEHALFIFIVLEETIIGEEDKRAKNV